MNDRRLPPAAALARALVEAARTELDLTPKPGLVDRRDNGSHPDLSYELMARSIDLLPRYFDELLEAASRLPSAGGGFGAGEGRAQGKEAHAPPADDGERRPQEVLDACVAAGRRAEKRMAAAVGSNTHRGYIFLSGLVLLATAAGARRLSELRSGISVLARRVLSREEGGGPFDSAPPRLAQDRRGAEGETKGGGQPLTPGALVRQQLGLPGIHGEALAGLPSVFEHALPSLERGLARLDSADAARHRAMATLMTIVEDTTAVHRCGRAGLDRLRADGARLLALIDGGQPHVPLLLELNDEYRAMRLTMGGVADCLALTIALREACP